jgi:hypothetical protein
VNSTKNINDKTYYGYKLPLGFEYGGPLFFTQYAFMGIDPNGLSTFVVESIHEDSGDPIGLEDARLQEPLDETETAAQSSSRCSFRRHLPSRRIPGGFYGFFLPPTTYFL